MVKKGARAGFGKLTQGKPQDTKGGYFHYPFSTGTGYTAAISEYTYGLIMQTQNEMPVVIMSHNYKTWWMFQNEYYWTDDSVEAEDAKRLIPEAQRQEQLEAANAKLLDHAKQIRKKQKYEREIEKAKATIAQVDRLKSDDRQPIPDDVKMFVWQRDKGRCVKCGSNKSLEFDHIIPFSQGGSNTARNLQILCETCNRSKGGNLF